MRGTQKPKAQDEQQQSPRDLGEKALEIHIKNNPLDADTIKALRLTCKRTKAAADARVTRFLLSFTQDSEAVQRSGLLSANITELNIFFNLRPSGNASSNPAEIVSRALGLLYLAVDVCSNSVIVMDVKIHSYPEDPHFIQACASALGNSNWEFLQNLYMLAYPLPGFLSGVVARPGSLLALKVLECRDPSAADLEFIVRSGLVGNLTSLSLHFDSHGTSTAPATVAAMRNLVQHATNLEELKLYGSTFEFFDSENLVSLEFLELKRDTARDADLTPVLMRPWPALESLEIQYCILTQNELVIVFEAEDILPVLKKVVFRMCSFPDFEPDINELSYVRRPHLEIIQLEACSDSHNLISRLAQLMKPDTPSTDALPSLQEFYANCDTSENDNDTEPCAVLMEAFSKFLSCPPLETVETLTIRARVRTSLLCDIANYCPKLKYLDLSWNRLGRPEIAVIAGYGSLMKAWPHLKKLGILRQRYDDYSHSEDENSSDDVDNYDDDEINRLYMEHPYMKNMTGAGMRKAFQRSWPGLICF